MMGDVVDTSTIRRLYRAMELLRVPEREKTRILIDIKLNTLPGHEIWRFIMLLQELGYSRELVKSVLGRDYAIT